MRPRRVAAWFAATFWPLFGLVSGFQVWISMITHGHSVPRLVGYHVLVWSGWIPITAGIAWLAGRFPVLPARRLPILVHLLGAMSAAVVHGLYWLALLETVRPFDAMQTELTKYTAFQILFGRLPFETILYGFVLAAVLALGFYERYRERELAAAQLEGSLAEARRHALELQIQPHFLFNTLNAIASLVRTGRNDEAVTMITGLSDLLRYALDHAGDRPVPLDEELEVLRRYLEIQRMRFPDRMSFTIEASPEARRAAVPALLLQPLAENAVRHGVAASASGGSVAVRAEAGAGTLRIEIWNTGSLAAETAPGIGLRNTRERLRQLFGEAGRLDLATSRGGVAASLAIPWSPA